MHFVSCQLLVLYVVLLGKLSKLPEPAESEKKENQEKKVETVSTKTDSQDEKPGKPSEKPSDKPAEIKASTKPSEKTDDELIKKNKKSCSSHPAIKNKALKGGKKAGKFRYFKNIKDMKTCVAKCCNLDKNCDVAYMEDGKCYTISCFKKALCMSVDKHPEEQASNFVYMDHFISKAEESEEVENDQGLGMSTTLYFYAEKIYVVLSYCEKICNLFHTA